MPGIMSILSLLDSVGVTRAEVNKAVEEASREAVIRTTKAALTAERLLGFVGIAAGQAGCIAIF
jgi:hypothetical protein